jgi:hypothetical protein
LTGSFAAAKPGLAIRRDRPRCILVEDVKSSEMTRRNAFYIGKAFFSVKDRDLFTRARNALFASFNDDCGIFAADNLITWGKSVGWRSDEAFARAFDAHATDPVERTIVWRTVTLAWAVRQALRVEGDFVECGCYKGTTARVLFDVAKLQDSPRKFYLYDLFYGAEGIAKHAMPEHSAELEQQVRERFSVFPNVVVTQGRVPESLAIASPDKIAFLHIDMNNLDAEIGALDALFERVSPGGVIILDDFGWVAYAAQMQAERDWFARRGYHILELPTGQGMVIK